MMKKYHPEKSPAPAEWLALDEGERIDFVVSYHKLNDSSVPSDARALHSTVHVIVENQIASDIEVVQSTMDNLMEQGLGRHDAIHAIGSVVADFIFNSASNEGGGFDIEKYSEKLGALSAKNWKSGAF